MAVKYVNWLDQGGPGRRLCLNLVMFIAFVILTALVVLGGNFQTSLIKISW